MKVGIITDGLEYAPLSIRNYIENLVTALLKIHGDNIILLHRQKSSHPLYREGKEILLPGIDKGSLYNPLSFLRRRIHDFFYYVENRNFLEELGIDVVHFPDLGRPAPPLCAASLPMKIVVTNHGMAQLSLPARSCYGRPVSRQQLIELKELLKWRLVFTKRCEAFITVSESERRILVEKGSFPEERVHVIYHGVSPDFSPQPMTKIENALGTYGIERPYVLHTSAYQPKKNTERVIKAFQNLDTDHTLVIVGPSQASQRLGDVKKKGRIIVAGFVDKKDLVSLYSGAEAFVFPSLHESFGMPILEAMGCGCPVITSERFSMPEVAGDAAVLVNPYCVEDITSGLRKVLTDPSFREELRERGLERVQKFSWEKSAREHWTVYKRASQ
ncbi:MAG: glycosyltransferase family 4 protein [Theionarchaea archaeon]|nr:glycosyltransferase family 4 protein [Theionarchaea archaeon]MBU7036564.1 glycosyltransferase family 4 protein [Theionarchaea archaeon]